MDKLCRLKNKNRIDLLNMYTYAKKVPLLLLAIPLFLLFQQIVNAQTSFPLSESVALEGYIWSGYNSEQEGIGWISMSCSNTSSCSADGGTDYGVVMDEDGYLNGYAWSPNVGWLKFGGFNPSEVPTNAGNARVDEDGYLRGWVRFESGDTVNNGGWDGWVRLHDSSATAMGVRFNLETGEVIEGKEYAWGSDTVAGWLDFSGVVIGAVPTLDGEVDLTVPNINYNGSGTLDRENGRYGVMHFPLVLRNIGEDGTSEGEDITWFVTVDDTVRSEVADETIQSSEPGPLAAGENLTTRASVNDFIYGVYEVTAEVNYDTSITETDYNNNTLSRTFTVRPPDPEIQISAVRDIVRTGERATITWDVVATYPMDCEVSGPGVSYSFDPSVNGTTGTRQTTPRTNASIYTVTCNEPTTDTTFTSGELRVEVVPRVQEL